MPAAAVIPALRVYMNVVVVKKHIADNDVSASLSVTSWPALIVIETRTHQWVASGWWKHWCAPFIPTQFGGPVGKD